MCNLFKPGIMLILSLVAGSLFHPAYAKLPKSVDGIPVPSLAPMLEGITPGVVNISTKAPQYRGNLALEEFFGLDRRRRDSRPNSLGSGVIIDAKRGLVITNNHVIENAAEIQVTLNDGRELVAAVVGKDPRADVAVLKIKPGNLTALKWANSDRLRVGDFCVAIGNPFGLGQTVTSGIVSALGRSGLGIEELEGFTQTDASINPGNSGGALVNLNGELIGINTAIVGPSGGNVGIGFAIPSNMAQDIVRQLVEFGVVRRGMLGISAQAITPDIVQRLGLKRNYGVAIVRIEPDSPAEKSGLELYDIIYEIDGDAIKTVESLINKLGLSGVGEEIVLRVYREGREFDIKTTVALLDEISPLLAGAVFEDLQTTSGRPYIIISSLEPGSRLDRLQLQAGDIILSVNEEPVGTKREMRDIAELSPEKLLLLVQRGQTTDYIEVEK